jgi:DNA-binding response OmpR family regulator
MIEEQHCPVSNDDPVILIIADHPDSLEMYARSLDGLGFQAVSADTLEEGLAIARRLCPAAIVADLRPSRSSDLELARGIRASLLTGRVPVVVLTSDGSQRATQAPRDVGCDRMLLKPCAPDALAAELRNLLARCTSQWGT